MDDVMGVNDVPSDEESCRQIMRGSYPSVAKDAARMALEKIRELASLRAENERLREATDATWPELIKHGFQGVLSGETGFTHLRCLSCDGDNESKSGNSLSWRTVKHDEACGLAAVIRQIEALKK